MTTNLPEPMTLILSRDELLSVLGVLDAATIPGMDSEPTGQRTEQGMLLAQEVATRSLRARGLARDENGTILYDDRLLNIVGTCAYPTSALTAFHWESAENAPARFFGNVRDDVCVAHTRPESLMHRFDMFSEKGQLADALLRFYQIGELDTDANSMQKAELALESETFATIRQLSEQGNTQEAQKVLIEHEVAPPVASRISSLFANNPGLTVLQTVTETDVDTVVKRDFMFAKTSDHLWFIGAVNDSPDTQLRIKEVTSDEIQNLVADWI